VEDAERYGVGIERIVLKIVLVGGGMKSGEGKQEIDVQRVCVYGLLCMSLLLCVCACACGCTHSPEGACWQPCLFEKSC
jgi:hypothetical protein